MNDIHDPHAPNPRQPPLDVLPVLTPYPYPRPSPLRRLLRFFVFFVLAGSLALNFLLLLTTLCH